MDFNFLVRSVRGIIHDPVKEWDLIQAENKSSLYFSMNLLFPLLVLASISAFLGSLLFTNTVLKGSYSILSGVKFFILLCLAIYGTTLIFKELTTSLGIRKDFASSFKIIVCSAVPFLLCQIVTRLFESFIFINILSFYGIYILWAGIERLTSPPERKKMLLTVSAFIAFIALLAVSNWILTLVFDKIYFSVFA
ncbi:MAG TPA: hypothetical protein DEO60_08455 [Bacteroidales bacterium]|jgi:hypothetical protein|nr:hypothetical protein [Bacteroidales bacterium]HBZ21144.1 hypothetical protein [Bacteroidales bacterium]